MGLTGLELFNTNPRCGSSDSVGFGLVGIRLGLTELEHWKAHTC